MQELQQRNKWVNKKKSVEVGDVVIIRDKNLPRNSWPLATVEELKISQDGLVRSVFLKLGKGTKRRVLRAIHDLVVLIPKSNQLPVEPISTEK